MEFLKEIFTKQNVIVQYYGERKTIGDDRIVKYEFIIPYALVDSINDFAKKYSIKIDISKRFIWASNPNYEQQLKELEDKNKQALLLKEKFALFLEQCEKDGIKNPCSFFDRSGYCCNNDLIFIKEPSVPKECLVHDELNFEVRMELSTNSEVFKYLLREGIF